ncbi:MAG: hypothetical protein J0M12_13015 [Deltaproteobacteria bacterium]|nr:hypothetical protein [Deltaproteobacteria bacterium]
MKKLLPLVVLILVVAGIWFAVKSGGAGGAPGSQSTLGNTNALAPSPVPAVGLDSASQANRLAAGAESEDGEEVDEEDIEIDTRLAPEIYKNAEDALAAVKNGSKDYDDVILSQFTQPGEDCTWCDTFYKSIKDQINAPDTKPEQKSYYAEILAISGRVENVSTLVDLIKNAKKPEDAQLYAEALELSVGKDDMVNFLSEQLKSKDETLKESSVAAITNQGSRLAAEVLYKNTVESGNPDGYYSQGIGIGELVPSEEAMPYLQELVQKRDQYSHLAVKSLLNSGLPGLRIVMDTLTNSKDPEADKAMLKDAIDHVNYEEDVEAYLKKLVETSKQPLVVDFAKSVLSDFATQEAESEEEVDVEEETEAPMSKMPQG